MAATLVVLALALAVAGLIDLVELLRRTASKENVPFSAVLEMMLLKLPHMTEELAPFVIMIGGMVALHRLTRSQELAAARASGISVWQFLAPVLGVAMMLGAFLIMVFNPLSSAMLSRYEHLESRYISGNSSVFSVSSSGLWLRQADQSGATLHRKKVAEYILHASHIQQEDFTMSDVTLFAYGKDGAFIGRIDAQAARLDIGYWQLSDAMVSVPGLAPERRDNLRLKTDLKITEIQDSFAEPRTLSFWALSGFIRTLEQAGFSALRHRIYWHAALSTPLLLVGMVLIASVFSLRQPRRGKTGWMVAGGLITGFLLNFLLSLFHAFGTSGSLPVLLAAWAPPAIVMMAGLALLLHLEDG